ncbi:Halocyanin [uncultured archaeon]|nr:Halocyanin [uncultured archaeon]
MKAIFLLSFVVALAISGCVGKQVTSQPTEKSTPTTIQPTLTPATVAVEIKGFAYNPANITISKGTTVVWTQNDSVSHTVTIASGTGFDSGTLNQGQTFSYTFNEAGTFIYGCSIHPRMSGKIIVQ